MQAALCLAILSCSGLLLQVVFVPAFVPPVLQPDVFILIGMTALAYSTTEFASGLLLALGICADLCSSGRFGVEALSFLLAGGVLHSTAQRELGRGDLFSAWLAAVAGTVLAHIISLLLNNFFGSGTIFGLGLGRLASLSVASLVWGLPAVYLTGSLLYRSRLMAPGAYARWVNAERLSTSHKRMA